MLVKSISLVGALALSAVAVTSCGADEGEKVRVRKNVKALTAEERADFVDAVLLLKDTPSPYDSTLSYYDQFVQWHHLSSLCVDDAGHAHVSHMNLSFLAWHRMFVYRFEEALREVSGQDITVPYWDWADPDSVASVFADDFMGGEGDPMDSYLVKDGPFRDWELTVIPATPVPGSHIPRLVRKFNTHYDANPMTMMPTIEFKLPDPAEVEALYEIEQFNSAPYDISVDATKNFQLHLEGWIGYQSMACDPSFMVMVPVPGPESHDVLHSQVHPWVAGLQLGATPEDTPFIRGTMAWSTSPNDPVFFLNHANVDRIWHKWQERHGKDNYAPTTDGPHGTNLKDTMMPFPQFDDGPNTIEELLDNDRLQIAYE